MQTNTKQQHDLSEHEITLVQTMLDAKIEMDKAVTAYSAATQAAHDAGLATLDGKLVKRSISWYESPATITITVGD